MRKGVLIILILLSSLYVYSQNISAPSDHYTEQQLENLSEQQENETEDDSYLQALIELHKHPINLNTANESDLHELRMLTDLQIQSLINYERLLGKLINIYELQAVPFWDIETIHQVLPYIKVENAVPLSTTVKERFGQGQHSVLLRMQQVLEKSSGFTGRDSIMKKYPGSPQKLFFRYKYVYSNLLQFGLTGDKDAGEQFFRGSQKQGFDFYSFHLFARKLGLIKSLAIGDFTVNLGQGLIHWQSLAFKKSSEIMAVKRQSDILRPYSSSGEYNFMRGAGITLGGESLNVTGFFSARKLDASYNSDTTQQGNDFFSSISTSGYHRTLNELLKKNTLLQTSFGGNVSFSKKGLHLGINGIAFKFSDPLVRDIQPYNQYAIKGDRWCNYSFDYSYTFQNFHFFGESAVDKTKSHAFVGGIIASLDATVDASLVYRNISKTYQSLYGNAFTENTFPTNEKGLYTGLSIKPGTNLTIDSYVDIFSFPWLRYRVDAPSKGTEYFIQVIYKPNKRFDFYTRFRNENKAVNVSDPNAATTPIVNVPKTNWRTQYSYNLGKGITLGNRVEWIWLQQEKKNKSKQGFLCYFDATYKPLGHPISLNGRLQYFKTDSSESRLYAFESDVLYSYSIPQFSGQGIRYYINVNFDISRKMTMWLRWSQTIYAGKSTIGSGLDAIDGNKKSEVKLQLLYNFSTFRH